MMIVMIDYFMQWYIDVNDDIEDCNDNHDDDDYNDDNISCLFRISLKKENLLNTFKSQCLRGILNVNRILLSIYTLFYR